MNDKETVDYIVHVLRHEPDSLDLELSDHGWTSWEDLTSGANAYLEDDFSQDDLQSIVREHENGRLEAEDDRVRSIEKHTTSQVSYDFQEPSQDLFYAVAEKDREKLLRNGFQRTDGGFFKAHETRDEAKDERPGLENPVVLRIKAEEAWFDGTVFYRHADNWYMKGVQAEHLEET